MGDRFLGHTERCRVLLHLVDGTGEDPAGAYKIVRGELEAYGAGLDEKIEVIGLNKIDAIDPKEAKKLAKKLAKASGAEVMPLSGAAGTGIEAVLDRLADAIGPVAEAEVESKEGAGTTFTVRLGASG